MCGWLRRAARRASGKKLLQHLGALRELRQQPLDDARLRISRGALLPGQEHLAQPARAEPALQHVPADPVADRGNDIGLRTTFGRPATGRPPLRLRHLGLERRQLGDEAETSAHPSICDQQKLRRLWHEPPEPSRRGRSHPDRPSRRHPSLRPGRGREQAGQADVQAAAQEREEAEGFALVSLR